MSTPWVPHNYQKTATQFCVSQGAGALFLDLGLGKSSITLATFKVLRDKGLVQRALVLAPLRPALATWRQEAARWTDFSDLSVKVLHGKDRNQAALLDSDISVGNYDALPQIFALADGLKAWPWQMLVCDEATRLKGYSTVRFKTLKKYLPKFARRYLLTATPAPNGLMDLFAQIYVLDQGASLGRFITHYRTKYFVPDFFGHTWTLRPGADKEIYEAIRPLVLRMEAKGLIDMPPLIFRTVEVVLPPPARRMYAQLEVELLAELNGNTVIAANAAAATNKLRQVACGNVYFEKDSEREVLHLHDEKLEAVRELVESAQGKPLLVVYEYKSDLAALQKEFPRAPYIGGGTTPTQLDEALSAWREGKVPVMLVHPASFSMGINAQCDDAGIVWYSVPWNMDWYTQLIGRLHRQGQKTPVIVHHIVAKDTVDETVMRVLASKAKTQTALLDALREDLLK